MPDTPVPAAATGLPRDSAAPMTVGVALGRLDDLLRDAHAALEIVDFLIEKGASSHLAYRATNPVFDAIRQALEIVDAAEKEAVA